MEQRRQQKGRPAQAADEASDLIDMKALAASARAGATPPPRINPAELSGVVARRDSVVGMRVLEPGAGGGLPGWFWGAMGCLSVIAVGLGAFSYLNLSGDIFSGDAPVPLSTVAGMASPSPTIVTIAPPSVTPGATAPQAVPLPPSQPQQAQGPAPAPGKPGVTKVPRRSKKLSEVDAMLAAAMGDRPAGRAPAASATSAPPAVAPEGKKAADEQPATPPSEPAAPARSPVEDVNAALDDLQPKLKQCFRRFQIPGIARVKLVVDPSGSIEPASLSGDFEGTPTGDCVMQELSSATLPPFKGSPLQLNHAFVLR